MNKENKELLEKYLEHNLNKAINEDDAAKAKMYLDRAIAAADKLNDQDKIDFMYDESVGKFDLEVKKIEEVDLKKLELENQKFEQDILNHEDEKKARFNDRVKDIAIKGVEIVAGVFIAKFIDYKLNCKLSDHVALLEKDEYFTTMPGKSLKGIFRFGK